MTGPTPSDAPPGLEFEFRLTIQVGKPIDQGVWEERRRRIIPILGGAVEGPRFKGVVLPGGADWQAVHTADGVANIYARQTLQHEDGTVIEMINPGVRHGPPEVMARLAAGERVDPLLYYFRGAPTFEVPPGPHRWLAESVFVCVGRRWPEGVELDVFRVL
ncbi:MAG: hypothetical protein BGN86_06025 [Caulobacterales bacterium 68-7]|nr:MAG: hypothetical protein BGN86_06025 [Caulobacterales bacterium 68-7]